MAPKKQLSSDEQRALDREKARKTARFGTEKEYQLDPGEYAGRIGDGEGILTVPENGKVVTSVVAEQAFIEGTLGREGKLTKEGKQDVAEQAEAQAEDSQEE